MQNKSFTVEVSDLNTLKTVKKWLKMHIKNIFYRNNTLEN